MYNLRTVTFQGQEKREIRECTASSSYWSLRPSSCNFSRVCFCIKKKDTRYVHDLDLEHGLVETIVRETDKSMVSISWEIFSALTMLPLIGNRYLVANCAQFRTPCTREPCFGGTGDKDATGGSTPLKRSLEKNVVRSVSTVLAVRARFLNRRPTRRWKRSLERDECRWTSQADSFSVRDHGVGEDFFPFAAIYYPKTVA